MHDFENNNSTTNDSLKARIQSFKANLTSENSNLENTEKSIQETLRQKMNEMQRELNLLTPPIIGVEQPKITNEQMSEPLSTAPIGSDLSFSEKIQTHEPLDVKVFLKEQTNSTQEVANKAQPSTVERLKQQLEENDQKSSANSNVEQTAKNIKSSAHNQQQQQNSEPFVVPKQNPNSNKMGQDITTASTSYQKPKTNENKTVFGSKEFNTYVDANRKVVDQRREQLKIFRKNRRLADKEGLIVKLIVGAIVVESAALLILGVPFPIVFIIGIVSFIFFKKVL